ncbi:MAG: MBL fold metallo-hydrolase [Candidatus Hydrogenedentes bacterium]|nr:MBL fold metallo-hydrolase [Candidatus Hydrogenedentota bacterium]
MQKIAEDLYLLDGFPKYALNVYLMGGVLVDAGTPLAKGRILRQLKGEKLTAHALTHVHPDHQGASKAVCEAFNVPLYCGENDSDAMESGDFSAQMPLKMPKAVNSLLYGPPHPVTKRLCEGDEVGGFTVLDAPGHTPGQVVFWRESDRVLVMGDVLTGMNLLTTARGLHQPPRVGTIDRALNIESARKLAKLNPEIVCFGHGPPWTDPDSFQAYVAQLPDAAS